MEFSKFLVDRDGSVLKRSAPTDTQESMERGMQQLCRKISFKQTVGFSVNLHQDFIAIYRDGKDLECVGRIIKTVPGFEVEPVAMSRAGKMTIFDNA